MKFLVLEQVIAHPDWKEEELEKFFMEYTKFLNDYEGIVVEAGKWEIIDEIKN
jgi:hypothetical protein